MLVEHSNTTWLRKVTSELESRARISRADSTVIRHERGDTGGVKRNEKSNIDSKDSMYFTKHTAFAFGLTVQINMHTSLNVLQGTEDAAEIGIVVHQATEAVKNWVKKSYWLMPAGNSCPIGLEYDGGENLQVFLQRHGDTAFCPGV